MTDKPVTPNKIAKGDGSVYQRKDGRWVAELPLPDVDGKRRSKTQYAKTKAGATAKLKEMRRAKDKNNGDLPTGSMRVSALMERWYTEVAEKTHKPKTAANERSVIRNHIVPSIGKIPLDKLSRTHFERLTASIEKKGLGAATSILAHSTLSSAVTYAFKADLITTDVSLKTERPSAPPAQLTILSSADGLKLLQAVGRYRLGSRVAAAFLTGGRQGELLGLELDRVGDEIEFSWQLQRISWQHGCGTSTAQPYVNKAGKPAARYLFPCGEATGSRCPDRKVVFPRNSEHRHLEGGLWLVRPKSKAGFRTLPMRGAIRKVIEYRIDVAATEPNPHGLLWTSDPKKDKHGRLQPLDGSPIDPRLDNEYWHRALVLAGLEHSNGDGSIDKMVRLHDARHTGASLFLEANIPEKTIMELMGHSSYAVTRRYQHVSNELKGTAMESLSLQLNYDPDEKMPNTP